MATNYPTSIDSFTNPTSGDTLDSPSHAAQHANINDAMVAVQTKLGVGSGTIGTYSTWTPTLYQNGVVASTVIFATYTQINKLVVAHLYVSATATGSAGSQLEVRGLPVAADVTSINTAGFGNFFDSSTSTRYMGAFSMITATSAVYIGDWSGAAAFGVTPSIALGNADSVRGTFIYEAA